MYSIKPVRENYFCSSSIACQERRKDWIPRIFTFNNKDRLYLPIILTLQFFEGQRDQGVTQLVIKPFYISQTSRIVGLRSKQCQGFPNTLLFFILFLENTSHKFWVQSPSPLINVVCKYLRQFLGTSFGVATLPICCKIEQGEWRDLFLQSRPFQSFHKFFQELTCSQ